MIWWQTLIVTLSTILVTKVIDIISGRFADKRNINRFRKEKMIEEIEILKGEVGKIFELSMSRQIYEIKKSFYSEYFKSEYELIGKYNKYPLIARAVRDTLQLCKIIASCERERTSAENERERTSTENEREILNKNFKTFLDACDEYIVSIS